MKPLDLQSERFSATGNVASEGVLNQLGRPDLDLLTVLLRESVQNSWDARLSDAETVRYGISGWTLTEKQKVLLRDIIFVDEPDQFGLRDALYSDRELQVLAISDRGTSGLDGPTRANIPIYEDEVPNFVNFLRNVGQPSGKPLGGGTFGYGKAVMYLASSVHTIIIHTHCLYQGAPESRFMAAALGSHYESDRHALERYQYTGRHWWGKYEDEVVDPVRGAEADELAHSLGLPPFAEDELGTTILILLPSLGEQSLLQSLHFAAVILLWYFWPKMIPHEYGIPSIAFNIFWDGQNIPIPDPGEFPPLQGFVQAFENLKSSVAEGESTLSRLVSIDCYNPKQHLGRLSLHRFLTKERHVKSGSLVDVTMPITELSHHVALMRKAELVIRYAPGPPLLTGMMEYAGVFIVDEKVDRVFARAEPPTHDDWKYQFLEDPRDRTLVRVAFRRIQEALQEFTAPPAVNMRSAELFPLGAFADRLGVLLPGAEGSGASEQPVPAGSNSRSAKIYSGKGENNGTSSRSRSPGNNTTSDRMLSGAARRAKVIFLNKGKLEMVEDALALLTEFIVKHAEGSKATRVKVNAGALLDGDELEKEPPAGATIPDVLLWVDPAGKTYSGSPEIVIPSSSTGPWCVAISIPEDAVLGISLLAGEEF